jgi:small GTP-binding protein
MQANLKKKICLIGAFAVGKTSLVQQYVYSIFSEKYDSTVGVRINKKEVMVRDRSIDLIIWDLHGEDVFQSIHMSYLRGTSGCFYVVDGTRHATLDTALKLRRRVEEAIGPTPSILAVNKSDLDQQWEIDAPTLSRLSSDDFLVIRTSAKTGACVEAAFKQLTDRMLEVAQ